jgi:hypothetical protein
MDLATRLEISRSQEVAKWTAQWSERLHVLPLGYVVIARRIADRRTILAGYRVVDLLMRVMGDYR